MASLLQQLQGDNALLLMYVVGELPPADRAEVEQRLAAEPSLHVELDRVMQMYGAVTSGLAELDAATPLEADVSAAVHRASAAIRQWQTRPVPAITPGVQHAPMHRWRIWAIPSAAAAIVLIVIGVAAYTGSNSTRRMAQGGTPFPPSGTTESQAGITAVVVPPPVNPQPELVATLIAGTSDIDTVTESVGPGLDQDVVRDDGDSKASHDDAGEKPVFTIPLP